MLLLFPTKVGAWYVFAFPITVDVEAFRRLKNGTPQVIACNQNVVAVLRGSETRGFETNVGPTRKNNIEVGLRRNYSTSLPYAVRDNLV